MPNAKWTVADIPDQHGRTVVITGANAGLGFETAKALAARGALVVMAVRSIERGKAAAARIAADVPGADLSLQELDLASLEGVRTAAEALRQTHDRIDLLINNAGVMYTAKGKTVDGFETQFGTNHLGHFALTGLLLERLLVVPGSRVVTVSSMAHRFMAHIHFDDLNLEQRYNRVAAYAQSKLANLLFTYELDRRLGPDANTAALAAHPGGSNTELARNLPAPLRIGSQLAGPLFAQSAAMGALPVLRAATDPAAGGGEYYGPRGPGESRGYPKLVRSSAQSYDPELRRRLWAVSEDLTGLTYPV